MAQDTVPLQALRLAHAHAHDPGISSVGPNQGVAAPVFVQMSQDLTQPPAGPLHTNEYRSQPAPAMVLFWGGVSREERSQSTYVRDRFSHMSTYGQAVGNFQTRVETTLREHSDSGSRAWGSGVCARVVLNSSSSSERRASDEPLGQDDRC